MRGTAGRTDVVSGALLPGSTIATRMVRDFQSQVNRQANMKRLFQSDPNRALGALGFSEDFRREIIRDSGLSASDSCWVTCIKTCWCTRCCCTGNTIVINL